MDKNGASLIFDWKMLYKYVLLEFTAESHVITGGKEA